MTLTSQVEKFAARLNVVKRDLAPDFKWYQYQTLSNLVHFDRLFPGVDLPSLVGKGPALDIGAADGDLSFFFESLGVEMHAIDNPTTISHGTRAIRLLIETLKSSVSFTPMDVDSQFTLPLERFSFVFLLGILYHLKNPFYVLDKLSYAAPWMLLNTKIARYAGGIEIKDKPLAYLLGGTEANRDDTNFWVFSETSLRVLLRRTAWEVRQFGTVGAEDSDPATRDQRAFVLARSVRCP